MHPTTEILPPKQYLRSNIRLLRMSGPVSQRARRGSAHTRYTNKHTAKLGQNISSIIPNHHDNHPSSVHIIPYTTVHMHSYSTNLYSSTPLWVHPTILRTRRHRRRSRCSRRRYAGHRCRGTGLRAVRRSVTLYANIFANNSHTK